MSNSEYLLARIRGFIARFGFAEDAVKDKVRDDEMVAILRNFVSCNEKTCALFVIADGPYFIGAKMAELRNHLRTSPPLSYALPIEELPAILATLAGV